jgi:four helix bundle protein
MSRQQYKFEKLEVWHLALELQDNIYESIKYLPDLEKYNLRSQMTRAVVSIGLNIAEGSTSSSDTEQARFLSISLHSLTEVIACLIMMERRKYADEIELEKAFSLASKLFAKLQSFRRKLLINNPI